jgi:hypothetical protein
MRRDKEEKWKILFLFRVWWISFGLSAGCFIITLSLVYISPSIGIPLFKWPFSIPLFIVPIVLGFIGLFFGFLWLVLSIIIRQRLVKVMGKKKGIFDILSGKYGEKFILGRFSIPLVVGVIMFFNLWLIRVNFLNINWGIGIGFLLFFLLLISLVNLFIPIMRESFLILAEKNKKDVA